MNGLRPTGGAGSWLTVGDPEEGGRRFGIPPGGPFDRGAARAVRWLVGDPKAPVLEAVLGWLELEVVTDGAVAIAGAVGEASADGAPVPPDRTVAVSAGMRLRIVGGTQGFRTYVAFREGAAEERRLRYRLPSLRDRGLPLAVLPGPYAHRLDFSRFLEATYRVSSQLDRSGIRLTGPPVDAGEEIPSEPTCVGAIQATPSGTLIVLGPDGPTIGGYPIVAVVADRDLDRLAQLEPGDEVLFRSCERSAGGVA